MTSCPTCGDLPALLTAQTGYGDTLPASAGRLTCVEGDLSAALNVCPSCDALFVFQDHPQFFGSGNLDEETLERLDEGQAALVRAFLREPDPARHGEQLFTSLQRPAVELLLRHLYRTREPVFRALLPWLLRELERWQAPQALGGFWLLDLLSTYAYGRERAGLLLEQLAGRSGTLVDTLTARLRSRLG